MIKREFIIGLDFDGTMVEHAYPDIGKDVPFAIEKILDAQRKGAKIILFTMRSGEELKQAVEYLENRGIVFYGVNVNPTQYVWTSSPKAYCHLFIDDASYGCPLIYPVNGKRPYVDWCKVNLDQYLE